MLRTTALTATLAAMLATPVLAESQAAPAAEDTAAHVHAEVPATVVDIAVGSPDHTTLVAAVQAANLASALAGEGPFTVFAPVDAAFAALPEGTLDTLLAEEDKATLTGILQAHVVPAQALAADVLAAVEAGGGSATFTTLGGAVLTATVADGVVTITDPQGNAAKVVAADIKAGNGVVHAIDAVLMP